MSNLLGFLVLDLQGHLVVFPRQKRGDVGEGSLLSGQLRNDMELSVLRREPVRIDNIRCCHIFSLKPEL